METTSQIPILQKAMDVIEWIAGSDRPVTPREASTALGIASTSAHRIFQTFRRRDWLHSDEDGRFGLGMGLSPLVQRLGGDPLFSEATRKAMAALAATTGFTCKLSTRSGDFALTIVREESDEPMALNVKLGSRFHLAVGASGAVLLSDQPDRLVQKILASAPDSAWEHQTRNAPANRIGSVKKNGCVVDRGSYRPDVLGISAPILDGAGRVRAALTLTGLAFGWSERRIESAARVLRETASQLSART